MSEKKIEVDMNLFKIQGKTRKKREPREKGEGGIKVKSASEKKKKETLKKRSILKMIRQHQEDRYKKLFEEKKEDKKAVQDSSFNNEFKEAQEYLQSLANKKSHSLNTTIKNYKPSELKHSNDNTSIDNTNKILPTNNAAVSLNPALQNIKPPVYGCLKNGTLPTYKTWMNNTRKQMPVINNPVLPPTIMVAGEPKPVEPHNENSNNTNNNKLMDNRISESIKRIAEMKEATTKLQQLGSVARPKKMRRKKTFRRTYKVGKSKSVPKVSVLVSNKTIRNNISTKSQLLKQVSIEEVKKFLVKRGLIKIGSITPNDVLRKMYESATMMCGEIYNHNPENLLYNFINDK
jgi:hypothetical protein